MKKNMYCTHPHHVVKNNYYPEHITSKLFKEKKGRCKFCNWMVTYEKCPNKLIYGETTKNRKSKARLVQLCKQKDKQIKRLTSEVIRLSEELEDLEFRYNGIICKYTNPK